MDKQINSEYLLIVRKHLDEIRMEMGNKPQFSLIISAHDSSVEIDEISGFACLAGVTEELERCASTLLNNYVGRIMLEDVIKGKAGKISRYKTATANLDDKTLEMLENTAQNYIYKDEEGGLHIQGVGIKHIIALWEEIKKNKNKH